jgi:hypothetical protein
MRRQWRERRQPGAMAHQWTGLDRPRRVSDSRVGYAQEHDTSAIAIRASPQRTNYPQVGTDHCSGEGAAEPARANYGYARVRQRIHAGKIATAVMQSRMG